MVIINGTGESGKDTFVDMVKRVAFSANISTVDPVKNLAKDVFKWNGKKDQTGRRLLADLVDAGNRFNGHWNKLALRRARGKASRCHFVFIHSREPHNIHWLKSLLKTYDPITVLVEGRGGGDSKGTPWDNHADSNVTNMDYDVVIDNSGSKADLEQLAVGFVEEWRRKDWSPRREK